MTFNNYHQVYFTLYYSHRCGFCADPKREFNRLPKFIILGKYMIVFRAINVEYLSERQRSKLPIKGTPTYILSMESSYIEYNGPRDALSIINAVKDKVSQLVT
jgi:hypothetical protein